MYEPRATSHAGVVVNELMSFQLIATSPILDWFVMIVHQDFDWWLSAASRAFLPKPLSFFSSRLLPVTTTSVAAYLSWVIFQAILYHFVPGRLHQAPRMPGGRRLIYKLNGLNAWLLTVILGAWVSYAGLARVAPDDKGHFWYDLFNDGELHPRTGQLFDWKHFNASRTGGIIAWTLIDLSFAALQHQQFGSVTNSVVLAVGFRAVIVAEYFLYEDLYVGACVVTIQHFSRNPCHYSKGLPIRFFETLDGAHERFSFYSIFGFAVMMPHLWTLQTQYLATHPVEVSPVAVALLVAGFASGWTLNHIANNQKNMSRRSGGKFRIAGREAETIEAKYRTADGKVHRTVLLCSGLWGIVRHPNYVGSITHTWASCLTCGGGHLLPYAKAILVTVMCVHRCFRDEARCKIKYADAWDDYCRRVRWRLLPGVF
ncbi:ergosterol biosynthesis ERG4/ERG24 family-domain-containing protein [Corynascus novoguineensis]|uniref:7-dehydrocholesterol reductase n=1 Tax=Corynascus novoguineensis TaxID=1126955 RepID=A0AAN7CZ38_9PEZI|nr:ergosterol biosynthesis ERG4/ERG24 family-domain-containing protein [Corynascus novoguineensis]